MPKPTRVVSGGQTGADRAALDWAIENDVPHGGWCPKGRRAEDGPISQRYLLQETPSDDYAQRTEWNVRDSDGTAIFSISRKLAGGSKATLEFARKLQRPVLHLSKERAGESPEKELLHFLKNHSIRTLNIAGPRSEEEAEVASFVKEVLDRAFGTKSRQT
jgi:hypothetical protein